MQVSNTLLFKSVKKFNYCCNVVTGNNCLVSLLSQSTHNYNHNNNNHKNL